MKQKAKKVELFVANHPTYSKVPQFVSKQFGIPEQTVQSRFLEFMVKETVCIVGNILTGVKCFEFDGKNFINKTVVSTFQ